MNKCGARTRNGRTCNNPAGYKTDHLGYGNCHLHAGATPNGITHAQREAATDQVARLGLPRNIDPQTALLEEVHRTAGHVAYLEQLVQHGTDELTVDTMFGPKPSFWFDLYRQERARLIDVCKAAVQCGVAERHVQLAEQQGHQIANIILLVFNDPRLGLSGEQRATGRIVVSEKLRDLTT